MKVTNAMFLTFSRQTVAMTRAKRHLAVICDTKTMEGTKKASKKTTTADQEDRIFLKVWIDWLKISKILIKNSKEMVR